MVVVGRRERRRSGSTSVEIDDTYGFLLGEWRIERTLTDYLRHAGGVFSGTVTISPSTFTGPSAQTSDTARTFPMAHYCEVGQLRLGAYRGTASRRLECVRQHDGGVTMTFEDGRQLVRCDLRSGRCEDTHRCREDRYEVSWRVLTVDMFSEQWRVRGPEKDYETRCLLRRVRDPEAARRRGA